MSTSQSLSPPEQQVEEGGAELQPLCMLYSGRHRESQGTLATLLAWKQET